VLIEIDGVRILTDPILSERASPFQFVGPARLHPPPLALEMWRNIDAVLISHDHFDHLDMDTVRHLAKAGTQFYVGLGIGAHLQRWEVPTAQIHEMDWWEHADIKGLIIHCTPARHYSGRTSMNNSRLWTSWLVKGPSKSFYYSGDTGYADHFKEIRARLVAPDMALIKIGAYGDTWMDIHMNPESAIQAQLDLGASTMLPVHWATFNLAYHGWAEPIVRTLAAAKEKGVHVVTPRVGEKFEFGVPFENLPWFKPQHGS
jgi:L-ascorbate metabolism protein UlaG (beta-lactamase superfamily)